MVDHSVRPGMLSDGVFGCPPVPLEASFCILLGMTWILLSPTGGYADEPRPHAKAATSPATARQILQTECPVLVGNKIDPAISTVYRGKRVYFCCDVCKSAFEKDPEKYLHRLPQFAQGSAIGAHAEHEDGHVPLARLIVPMGATTLVLVAITVCLGLFRRLNPKLLKWHKRIGPVALAAGAFHAALVLFLH